MRTARSYVEATKGLEEETQQGITVVAIYNVFDWRTDWRLSSPHKRETHEKAVLDVTAALRLKYE